MLDKSRNSSISFDWHLHDVDEHECETLKYIEHDGKREKEWTEAREEKIDEN